MMPSAWIARMDCFLVDEVLAEVDLQRCVVSTDESHREARYHRHPGV